MIVPVYRPATAETGTAMAIVGSHVAELSPLPGSPADNGLRRAGQRQAGDGRDGDRPGLS